MSSKKISSKKVNKAQLEYKTELHILNRFRKDKDPNKEVMRILATQEVIINNIKTCISNNQTQIEKILGTTISRKYFDNLYKMSLALFRDYFESLKALAILWYPYALFYRVNASYYFVVFGEKYFAVGYDHKKVFDFDSLCTELTGAYKENELMLLYFNNTYADVTMTKFIATEALCAKK
jgi:hypothetical protein